MRCRTLLILGALPYWQLPIVQLFCRREREKGLCRWLVGWLDGWLLSQRLKNSNYHLIIKNACAYRINPSASIAPFRIRIRLAALLIAYQCSISISRARISRWGCGCGCGWGWGGRSGWAAGCTVRQSDSLAVHHSVIDSNGVAVDVSSGSGIGGCHLLIVVATDGN